MRLSAEGKPSEVHRSNESSIRSLMRIQIHIKKKTRTKEVRISRQFGLTAVGDVSPGSSEKGGKVEAKDSIWNKNSEVQRVDSPEKRQPYRPPKSRRHLTCQPFSEKGTYKSGGLANAQEWGI